MSSSKAWELIEGALAVQAAMPDLDALKDAVERRCSAAATLVQTVPVSAPIQGSRTWDVVVHVYDVPDCRVTAKAYAWSAPVEGPLARGDAAQVFTALDIGPIKTPMDAVRATLADQMRQGRLATR